MEFPLTNDVLMQIMCICNSLCMVMYIGLFFYRYWSILARDVPFARLMVCPGQNHLLYVVLICFVNCFLVDALSYNTLGLIACLSQVGAPPH